MQALVLQNGGEVESGELTLQAKEGPLHRLLPCGTCLVGKITRNKLLFMIEGTHG